MILNTLRPFHSNKHRTFYTFRREEYRIYKQGPLCEILYKSTQYQSKLIRIGRCLRLHICLLLPVKHQHSISPQDHSLTDRSHTQSRGLVLMKSLFLSLIKTQVYLIFCQKCLKWIISTFDFVLTAKTKLFKMYKQKFLSSFKSVRLKKKRQLSLHLKHITAWMLQGHKIYLLFLQLKFSIPLHLNRVGVYRNSISNVANKIL